MTQERIYRIVRRMNELTYRDLKQFGGKHVEVGYESEPPFYIGKRPSVSFGYYHCQGIVLGDGKSSGGLSHFLPSLDIDEISLRMILALSDEPSTLFGAALTTSVDDDRREGGEVAVGDACADLGVMTHEPFRAEHYTQIVNGLGYERVYPRNALFVPEAQELTIYSRHGRETIKIDEITTPSSPQVFPQQEVPLQQARL